MNHIVEKSGRYDARPLHERLLGRAKEIYNQAAVELQYPEHIIP